MANLESIEQPDRMVKQEYAPPDPQEKHILKPIAMAREEKEYQDIFRRTAHHIQCVNVPLARKLVQSWPTSGQVQASADDILPASRNLPDLAFQPPSFIYVVLRGLFLY